MKWKKVFLKEKVSKANWLSLFTEPCSLQAPHTAFISAALNERRDVILKELRNLSLSCLGGRSKETL